LSKWHKEVHTEDKVIPWIAEQVELSKSVCFDFGSTNMDSSVIKTGRSDGSLLPYSIYEVKNCHNAETI
jgi:hypothetical protein